MVAWKRGWKGVRGELRVLLLPGVCGGDAGSASAAVGIAFTPLR